MKIRKDLKKLSSPKIAKKSQYYFKTKKGQYSYGDIFIGVKSADLRSLAKTNTDLSITDTKILLKSKIHEERALALLILVYKYKSSNDDIEHQKIFNFYTKHFKYINNWDLVDCSSPHIVGIHLMNRNREVLYTWIQSEHLWTRRIAMLANWWFVRKGDLKDVFKMAKILLNDEHDLMHKAVGWMLREAGKKDNKKLTTFLKSNYKSMPRTMLRYSIEKFPENLRQKYLKGKI